MKGTLNYIVLPNNFVRQKLALKSMEFMYQKDINLFRELGCNLTWAFTPNDNLEDKYYTPQLLERVKNENITGKICCAISHTKLWEQLLNSNDDFSIIVEDDAILNNHFFDHIKTVIQKSKDYDIILLWVNPWVKKKINLKSDSIVIDCPPTHGNVCYIINRNGAEKLINSLPYNDFKDLHIMELAKKGIIKMGMTIVDLANNHGAINKNDNKSPLGSTIFNIPPKIT